MTNNMKFKTIRARAASLLLLAVLSSSGAWAQETAPGIVVWFNDGNKTSVLFTDKPEITYADGYITFQTDAPSTALSWPLEKLQNLTFEDVSTSIKATGLDIASDKLEVYDLNGRMVKKHIKSLSELPKGTFIVKDGSVTIKVVRR